MATFHLYRLAGRLLRPGRRRQVALLVGVAVAGGFIRVLVFEAEWFAGPTAERYADLVLAGVVLLVGVALTAPKQNKTIDPALGDTPTSEDPEERPRPDINLVGAALGAALAAVGLVQLIFPGTPYQAAAPACRGVSVASAPFLAQTQKGGVNARTGPSTGYPQVDRYAGGCTLGFDGYCVGQEVPDVKSDLVDTRWLLVHGESSLIASAKVEDQSAVAKLGRKPDDRCTDLGGVDPPTSVKFKADLAVAKNGDQEVSLQATSRNAALIGYSVRVVNPVDGYEQSLIGVKPNQPNFEATWVPSSAASSLPDGTGRVRLAAAPCLAADHATKGVAMYEATFKDGQVTTLLATEPQDDERALMRRMACSGPP